MSKTEKTHVVMLLDESGSMGPHRTAVVETFNGYVNKLKEETKRCYLSLYKFDTGGQFIHKWSGGPAQEGILRHVFINRKVGHVYPLTMDQYSPRGGTPLFDATALLINETKARLSKKSKVIFVIHTDGQENASTRFNQESVRSLIVKCEKKRGWNFIYLGEGREAWNAGYDFGILNVSNFVPETRGRSMEKLAQVTTYVTATAKAETYGSHQLYDSAGIQNADDCDPVLSNKIESA